MRQWWRLPGAPAALVVALVLGGCATQIRDINLRPDKFYQSKVTVSGRIARMQSVDGGAVLEIADRRENRILVRSAAPVNSSVGDWVKVTGVLVPEALVGDTTLYDVLTAESVSGTRGPWLPEIM